MQLVVEAVRAGDPVVTADVRRVAGYGPGEGPADARELAGRLLSCVYMGTVNSSKETRDRCVLWVSRVCGLAGRGISWVCVPEEGRAACCGLAGRGCVG